MKKIVICIFLTISVISFSACGSKNKTVEVTNTKTLAENSKSENNQITNNKIEVSNDKKVITDISKWDHPVKDVFITSRIPLEKVELTKNNTYPTFYTTLSENVDSNHKSYYENLFKAIAAANGFWDYKLLDESKNINLEISCDKTKKQVTSIVYNNDKKYFSALKANDEVNEAELINYLIKAVPEVKSFQDVLAKDKNGVRAIIYVERMPDANAKDVYMRDYYGMYVGENHSDHIVYKYRFAINKYTKNILFYDVVQDKYMTLDELR